MKAAPSTCPRCGTPAKEWQYDPPGGPFPEATCPCGEVFRVARPEVAPLARETKVAHKAPPGWKAHYDLTSWHARMGVERNFLILMMVLVPFLALQMAAAIAPFGIWLGLVVLGLALVALRQQLQQFFQIRLTFRVDPNALTIEGVERLPLRFPLDGVLEVRALEKGRLAQLGLVNEKGELSRIELWRRLEEMGFVCDAINTAIANRGRSPQTTYRGEQVRIANEHLRVAGTPPTDEAEETLHNGESRARDSAEK